MEGDGRLLALGIGFTEMANRPAEANSTSETMKASTGKYLAKGSRDKR